jgi:hypothetical protein
MDALDFKLMRARLLSKMGFKFGRSGAHSARTMMLPEIQALFARVPASAGPDIYAAEIVERNALGKPTLKARNLTARHLTDLYGLDPAIPIFRALRRLWDVDAAAQPLLALTIALARDPLLRLSWDFMSHRNVGDPVTRAAVEELLRAPAPDRFTAASLKSFAQNINGTWTQAGFLHGKVTKHRATPTVSPANFAYAAFLAWLENYQGQRLMQSRWVRLLDRQPDETIALATAASKRGLLVFMAAGGVFESRFPGYLSAEEEGWLREQA